MLIMSRQLPAVCDSPPPADATRVRLLVDSGVALLRSGWTLDAACEEACGMAEPHERAAVRVGIEARAAEVVHG